MITSSTVSAAFDYVGESEMAEVAAADSLECPVCLLPINVDLGDQVTFAKCERPHTVCRDCFAGMTDKW